MSALLLFTLPVPLAQAQNNKASQQQSGITPRQAAEKAKAQHGGKVLKVTPRGKGYQVKLLLDSGRVKTVRVEG
jgi:uncharacterized membrane protein YkoI